MYYINTEVCQYIVQINVIFIVKYIKKIFFLKKVKLVVKIYCGYIIYECFKNNTFLQYLLQYLVKYIVLYIVFLKCLVQ
jgi:hypothetical protein